MEKEVALTAVEIWGWNGLGARVAIFSSSWSPQSWGEVCLRWLCCQRKPMDMVMTNVSDLWGFFILYFPCSLMCLMKSSRGSTDWSANGNLISFGSTFSDSTSIYFTVPETRRLLTKCRAKKKRSLNKCHPLGGEKIVFQSWFHERWRNL